MTDSAVLTALREEVDALAELLGDLPSENWDHPTRCEPWQVRDVVAHVTMVLGRVPDAVADTAPARPDTTAMGYYRADRRFSTASNARRVSTARLRALVAPSALLRDLTEASQAAVAACHPQPDDRLIRTRHGDALLLTDFLVTRILEVAAHGLDIADAVGHSASLTPDAAHLLLTMLVGQDWPISTAALGWSPIQLLRKATGRAPVDGHESEQLHRLGVRLTLA